MIYLVKPPKNINPCELRLPTSKSISNRVLIMRSLAGNDKVTIKDLSVCDDTNVMTQALENMPQTIDVGAAGTSMRFLTAYLSQLDGQEHVITGSQRMKERPIGVLVEALRLLGADIEYVENEGYPPLRIKGRKLKGASITIKGNVSSQYISALLMIAPYMEEGLKMKLSGDIASKPYIDMTLALMNRFGAKAFWLSRDTIAVVPQPYTFEGEFTVEGDWSAASYWFEIMSMHKVFSYIHLANVDYPDSVQGDHAVAEVFAKGKLTAGWDGASHEIFKDNLIREFAPQCFVQDFSNIPDLAQTFVVTCCMKNQPFMFSGLNSLYIKETDRVKALINELSKLGYKLVEGEDGVLMWQRGKCRKQSKPVIKTYKDHRMAMAFAPCCMVLGEIRIEDPGVVSKSYPEYWDVLREVGFEITEIQEGE